MILTSPAKVLKRLQRASLGCHLTPSVNKYHPQNFDLVKVVIQSACCDVVAMCWVKKKNFFTCQKSVLPVRSFFSSYFGLRKLQHFQFWSNNRLCLQSGGWKYWARKVGSQLEESRQVRQSCMFHSTSMKLMEENRGYWWNWFFLWTLSTWDSHS